MQCVFQHGGKGSTQIMRGGYSIDKKDARIRDYYIPIGLHHHGEDTIYEEPVEEFDMEYHDEYPILDQSRFDEMLYIAMVEVPKKPINKTRKQKRTKK